jgi:hypothetical protein
MLSEMVALLCQRESKDESDIGYFDGIPIPPAKARVSDGGDRVR